MVRAAKWPPVYSDGIWCIDSMDYSMIAVSLALSPKVAHCSLSQSPSDACAAEESKHCSKLNSALLALTLADWRWGESEVQASKLVVITHSITEEILDGILRQSKHC